MGKTILISSHILPELAEMCDSLGIIDGGKLVAEGSVSDIQAKLQGEKMIIVKMMEGIDRAIAFFEDDPYVSKLIRREEENTLQFIYRGSSEEQTLLLKKAILNQLPIISFSEVETDLEDVFMEITRGVELA